MSSTFVVAVDGSEGCARALKKAIDMGNREGTKLVLVHVIEWSAFTFHTPDELAERHARREQELERANEFLLGPAGKVADDAGFTCDTIVRHGHPAETLAEIAEQEAADFIFIGRKGQSKMGSLLFGSVAGSLIQISPISVTVVP